jgi:hypothetical protein
VSKPFLKNLSFLSFRGDGTGSLASPVANRESLPRLAVDVNRKTKGLLMREFLREFLALERVKSVHVSIVHGYMIAGFRKRSTTSMQIFVRKKSPGFSGLARTMLGGPSFCKSLSIKDLRTGFAILDCHQISDRPTNGCEVRPLFLYPQLLTHTAELAFDPLADRDLLAVTN